jgi:hypothetical protein
MPREKVGNLGKLFPVSRVRRLAITETGPFFVKAVPRSVPGCSENGTTLLRVRNGKLNGMGRRRWKWNGKNCVPKPIHLLDLRMEEEKSVRILHKFGTTENGKRSSARGYANSARYRRRRAKRNEPHLLAEGFCSRRKIHSFDGPQSDKDRIRATAAPFIPQMAVVQRTLATRNGGPGGPAP